MRYIVQHNGQPTGSITPGSSAAFGPLNSHPWRVFDTVENRSSGFYTSEADAELMQRFLEGIPAMNPNDPGPGTIDAVSSYADWQDTVNSDNKEHDMAECWACDKPGTVTRADGLRLCDEHAQPVPMPANDDDWTCSCGNQPHTDGFYPCDSAGNEVEPTPSDWPEPLYVCGRCQQIIRAV